MPDEEQIQVADELFWLGQGARILEESEAKLIQGAESVAAAMAWFWTVYSAAAAAALLFMDRQLSPVIATLVAAPAITLFVAYGLAVWSALPVPIAFQPSDPYDIKGAFEEVIRHRRARLRTSLLFSGITAMLVASVVVATVVANRDSTEGVRMSVAGSAGSRAVAVGGFLKDAADLLVTVEPKGLPRVDHQTISPNGKAFSFSVPVEDAPSYAVEVRWKDGERIVRVSEELVP